MLDRYYILVRENLPSCMEHRTACMGISMIMVLFYHLNTTFFYPGFLGVDIFLFLSAYGLSRSWERNSCFVFYKRRFKRLVPMYLLFGILQNFIYIYFYHYQLSTWDLICNITSLNYWKLGGLVFEWYLSILILLYLLFPAISVCVKRVGGGKFLAITLVFSLMLLTFGFDWNYDTAIGRLPIFVLGIVCYQQRVVLARMFILGQMLFFLSLLCSIILYAGGALHFYVVIYMFSPAIILLVGWLINKVIVNFSRVYNAIFYIGRYTLEIYIANVLICLYRRSPDSMFEGQNIVFGILLYIVMNIIISLVVIMVGKYFSKIANTI